MQWLFTLLFHVCALFSILIFFEVRLIHILFVLCMQENSLPLVPMVCGHLIYFFLFVTKDMIKTGGRSKLELVGWVGGPTSG